MTYVYYALNFYVDGEHVWLAVYVRITQWKIEISFRPSCNWNRTVIFEWSTSAACVFTSRKDTVVIVVHVQQPPSMLTGSVRPTKIVRCSCVSRKIFISSVEARTSSRDYAWLYPFWINFTKWMMKHLHIYSIKLLIFTLICRH